MSANFSVWLGKVSFGLYLTHGTVGFMYISYLIWYYPDMMPTWTTLYGPLALNMMCMFPTALIVASIFTEIFDQSSMEAARYVQWFIMEDERSWHQITLSIRDHLNIKGIYIIIRFIRWLVVAFKNGIISLLVPIVSHYYVLYQYCISFIYLFSTADTLTS